MYSTFSAINETEIHVQMKINVEEIINSIENFDYSNFSNQKYSTLKELMSSLFPSKRNIVISNMNVSEAKFFRVRENAEIPRFKQVKDLWHPEPKYVNNGRFNFKSKPVLYLSTDARTAMIEKDVCKHEFFTICEYKALVANLRVIDFGSKLLPIDEVNRMAPETKLIMEFFSREAKKNVPNGKEEQYCPTMIFGTSILQNSVYEGLLYESVATENKGLNIAIKSSMAESLFMPVEYRKMQVYDQINKYNFKVRCLEISNNIGRNLEDRINWEQISNCNGHNININELNYFEHN
jgi:hypothetical protein